MNMKLPANWQTTISGVGSALFAALSLIAAVPYELGELALLIPPEYKAKVVLYAAIAAFLLRIWNSIAQKDWKVTGGAVQQDVNGKVATPQEPTPAPPQAALPELDPIKPLPRLD